MVSKSKYERKERERNSEYKPYISDIYIFFAFLSLASALTEACFAFQQTLAFQREKRWLILVSLLLTIHFVIFDWSLLLSKKIENEKLDHF